MTGPKHYAEGERELQQAYDAVEEADRRFHLDAAQVHFTAAAVTLLVAAHEPNTITWQEAIGP